VQWLVDHVRWDLEEDLSRLFGDAPAHALGQVVGRMADALRQFGARGAAAVTPATPAPAAPTAPGQAGG
jgi:ubiquinone biosynthesis protein UbiJ